MIKVELQNKFVYVCIDDNDWMLIRDEKENICVKSNIRIKDCRSYLMWTFWEDTKFSDIVYVCERYSVLPK
jgi:hypothetical protein